MTPNRNSKKWKELYRTCLIQTCVSNGIEKTVDRLDRYGYRVYKIVDAMPDRIKEAEEYADRLYSAMR